MATPTSYVAYISYYPWISKSESSCSARCGHAMLYLWDKDTREARVCFQYYRTIIKLTLRVLDEETDFPGKQPDRKLLLSDLLL